MNRNRPPSRRRAALALGLVLGLAAAGSALADDPGVYSASTFKTIDGRQVYTHICQGCHMPDGQGAVGAGHYPAFAGNPVLASAPYLASTVLNGRHDMPSFAERKAAPGSPSFNRMVSLTDAQVASVVNYIRSHFGNHYADKITTAEVTALRLQSQPAH